MNFGRIKYFDVYCVIKRPNHVRNRLYGHIAMAHETMMHSRAVHAELLCQAGLGALARLIFSIISLAQLPLNLS